MADEINNATPQAPAPNKNMTTCKSCGASIAKNAKTCPSCGAKNKKPIYKRPWFIILAVIVVIAIIASIGGGSDETSGGSSSSETTTTENKATNYTINVGEKYTDSVYCDIEFVSANTNFTAYSKYADVPSGMKVIQATFSFTNNTDSDFLASAYDFDCFADDESCEAFWSVDDAGFSDTLSAGKKASNRNVYFLVPEGATNIILEYELNMWSDNRIEFVVK